MQRLSKRVADEITEHGVVTVQAEIELCSIVGFLVEYLKERSTSEADPLPSMHSLLSIYGKTGSRERFRSVLKRCVDEAGNDEKKLYAIANSVCYVSGTGMLDQEDDYIYFRELFVSKYGASYFGQLTAHMEKSKLSFPNAPNED